MKTAPKFHLYVLDAVRLPSLAATGLDVQDLPGMEQIERPALVLLAPGQKAPEQLDLMAIELPADASPSAVRELIRIGMENVVLKQQMAQLEAEAHRRHRQFRELNRIGVALSAEKDIERLQSFILTTMRQLTHADGASLWLKMDEDSGPKLFLASSQNHSLDSIQALVDGFVQASVTAIEQRDPSTAGHSGRVEGLTTRLARAINEIATGTYRNVHLGEDQLKELRYACLLHDFGKVGVRGHILIKAKKLGPCEPDVIRARFEFIERSVQVKYATEKLEAMKAGRNGSTIDEIDRRLTAELAQLNEWVNSIAAANEPTVMPEDKASMLEFLSQQTYYDISGNPHPMLEPQEFRFLSIRKGTLDPQERLEMESHVTHSFHFLTKIPWTPVMKGIPEIAYGHHEKLDGSGYPRRLAGEQIPLQARMMTISDIFDALTAQDRPYKKAVSSQTALDILHEEAAQGKLDRDLLDIFVAKKIYLPAAAR